MTTAPGPGARGALSRSRNVSWDGWCSRWRGWGPLPGYSGKQLRGELAWGIYLGNLCCRVLRVLFGVAAPRIRDLGLDYDLHVGRRGEHGMPPLGIKTYGFKAVVKMMSYCVR